MRSLRSKPVPDTGSRAALRGTGDQLGVLGDPTDFRVDSQVVELAGTCPARAGSAERA